MKYFSWFFHWDLSNGAVTPTRPSKSKALSFPVNWASSGGKIRVYGLEFLLRKGRVAVSMK